MYCDSCMNRTACELFTRVCAHEVEFCMDYIDGERDTWRKDWFEASENEWGEYSPDDFEF